MATGILIAGQFIIIVGLIGVLVWWNMKLMTYIKPDTEIKLRGMDEIKKEIVQWLSLEKRRIQEKMGVKEDIRIINTAGE